MKIESGLFAGVEVPESEISFLANQHGGDATAWWAPAFRTPHFTAKFSPFDGWSVEVESKEGSFNLPDYANASQGAAPPVQPTQLFLARLIKAGTVFATASSLELIDGEKAWERGETNARGRLYEALGLPGAIKGANREPSTTGTTSARQHGKPPLVVVPLPGPKAAGPAEPATGVIEAPVTQVATSDTQASDTAPPTPAAAQTDAAPTDADVSKPVQSTAKTPSASKAPRVGEEAKIQHAADINANLLKQIQTQAKLLGLPMRSLSSNDDAKAFFGELLATPKREAS